jgi:hypothetical protein
MNVMMTPPRGPVAQCVHACKATIASVQQQHIDAVKHISLKYFSELSKMGLDKVLKAATKKDALGALKAVNVMLEDPKMVDVLCKMIQDFTAHYKAHARTIDEIIQCYLNHCDKEAIAFLHETIRMSLNMMRLAATPKVKKSVSVLQSLMTKNVERALAMLKHA